MIGILVPMPEEIELLLSEMKVTKIVTLGRRDFHLGELCGKSCVVALSRIGKVASSVTAATMILEFGVSHVILTGAAGAIHPNLQIGDMIVATETIQHDLDCSPLFPRFEAPLLGISRFPCDGNLMKLALQGFQELVVDGIPNFLSKESIAMFSLTNIRIYEGLIGSGDQFIGSKIQSEIISTTIPDVLCVEMEAGAVGQVCYEYNVPYIVLRTISDLANGEAHIDFVQFVNYVVSPYTFGMVSKLLSKI
jgi:adenosylhomocysteine nucleosidase